MSKDEETFPIMIGGKMYELTKEDVIQQIVKPIEEFFKRREAAKQAMQSSNNESSK